MIFRTCADYTQESRSTRIRIAQVAAGPGLVSTCCLAPARDRAHNLRPFTPSFGYCDVYTKRSRCFIRTTCEACVCSIVGVHPSYSGVIWKYGFVGVPPSWRTWKPTTARCAPPCLARALSSSNCTGTGYGFHSANCKILPP